MSDTNFSSSDAGSAANLAALAGVTSAADKLFYFTGSGTGTVATITSFARTLIDDVNQAAMQATLALVPGINVQAWDADLDALAALSTTGLVARTGDNTYVPRTITAGSTKIAITNGGGVAGNPTIDVTEANLTLDSIGGTLGISKGGTGQITQTLAFNALSPLTTLGDIVLHNGTNSIRLPIGTAGQVLTVSGGTAAWAAPTGGITTLNTLTATTQTFAAGTSGTDFNIASVTSTHTFNLPDASASARGLITTGAQTIAGSKTFSGAMVIGGNLTVDTDALFVDAANNRIGVGTASPDSVVDVRIASAGNVRFRTSSATDEVGFNARSSDNKEFQLTKWGPSQSGTSFGVAIAGGAGIVNDGTGVMIFGNVAAQPIIFATNAAERVRILSSGNVGIGTPTPDHTLHVVGDINTTAALLRDGTQVVTARQTGWGAPTGTATRTTFATSTVTLSELAERVKGLIDDTTTHGLIGA